MINYGSVGHFSNHRKCNGLIAHPLNHEDILQTLHFARTKGLRVSVMGSQNSFSDIFLASEQQHISLAKQNKILELNRLTGEITVQAGARIWEVLKLIMPLGFYLTGLSGSYSDTIGGLISSNCHGKDSHIHGNFGNNIVKIKLINYKGETLTVNRDDELLKAIVGGLGALGIISEVTLKLKNLPSCNVNVIESKCSFEDLIGGQVTDKSYAHAWLDLCGKPFKTLLIKADFANNTYNYLDENELFPELKPSRFGLPAKIFWKSFGLVWNRNTYFLLNRLFYLRAGKKPYTTNAIEFLYPWRTGTTMRYAFKNESYYELQTLFPAEKFENACKEMRRLMEINRIYPCISAIKWHIADNFYLSFSGKGLSVSNSFDSGLINNATGQKFIAAYIEIVLKNKGKFYLSKFPYLTKEHLQNSYPDFERWLRLKQIVDPENIFLSDRISAMCGIGKV